MRVLCESIALTCYGTWHPDHRSLSQFTCVTLVNLYLCIQFRPCSLGSALSWPLFLSCFTDRWQSYLPCVNLFSVIITNIHLMRETDKQWRLHATLLWILCKQTHWPCYLYKRLGIMGPRFIKTYKIFVLHHPNPVLKTVSNYHTMSFNWPGE